MKTFRNVFTVLMLCIISTSVYSQSNFSGNWIVGEKNTVVKIEQINGVYIGKIISSDNPKAEIGKLMVKDLKQTNGKWKGKIYAPKRKEWYDANFSQKGNNLIIEITVGYFSKTIEWTKK